MSLSETTYPFATATILLRSEKATVYRESMSEIDEDNCADLDWDAEIDEDLTPWERST